MAERNIDPGREVTFRWDVPHPEMFGERKRKLRGRFIRRYEDGSYLVSVDGVERFAPSYADITIHHRKKSKT